jgi:hypothetical protein
MAMFNPKDRPKQDDDGVPGGDYLLVLKNFARKIAQKSGLPYLRARYEVIAGPAKGKQFFDSIGLDISNSGTALRLSIFAELCGVTESFDLDDDDGLRERLCGKPFKARVKRSISGQYVNNGIERYFQAKDVSQREQEIMNVWAMEWEERGQRGQGSFDGGAPHAADGDDFGGGGGWGGGGASGTDDDIPF